MKRREFITLLGGAAAAWPFAARAQQAIKVPRVGFLGLAPASAFASRVEALRAGLRDHGYVEGTNIAMEFRWAETVDRLPEFAADLVRMKVDVIFAQSSTMVEAARKATNAIPIVFAVHADPIGVGHVASLARPGGNITGLSMLLTELAVKELEILKEAVPRVMRIGVLWNPTTPSHQPALQAVEAAGEKLGSRLVTVPLSRVEQFEDAFSLMAQERVGSFLCIASPLFTSHPGPLAELARKHRLPGMFGDAIHVEAGGLMSYSADVVDLFRRSAFYIDRILKGEKPADLPVQQPTKFVLVINLRTAKAIGLTIPETFLLRADKVIE
jgi:putative ABC transport system substrate-binding protein